MFLLHIIMHSKSENEKKTHYDTKESFRTSASAKFEREPRRKKTHKQKKQNGKLKTAIIATFGIGSGVVFAEINF